MANVPRERRPDSSIALLREGYRFIPNRVRKHNSNIFRTRLMLRKATCVSGMDAAEMFYQPDRFTRVGAMPPTTVRLLQDKDSVQMLQGQQHRHRKAMFMSVMTPGRIDSLLKNTGDVWSKQIDGWSRSERVVLLDEAERLLCRAVTRWAGLDITERSLDKRTREFSAMLSGSGGIGPETWRALLLRERCERWARSIIKRVRAGRLHVAEDSPLAVFANHRDDTGKLLPSKIAAVEMINILRPTVAVARYIVFAAHALENHPQSRRFVESGDDQQLEWFVQEVRRHYPFFPFIGGIATTTFSWNEYTFEEGDWVILDVYGTNHDRRIWEHPDAFDPERFRAWNESPYNFIPQGGGDHFAGHRCAGEWITIALLKQAAATLSNAMSYSVPTQDLSISLRHMPAQPASGFILADVRPVA